MKRYLAFLALVLLAPLGLGALGGARSQDATRIVAVLPESPWRDMIGTTIEADDTRLAFVQGIPLISCFDAITDADQKAEREQIKNAKAFTDIDGDRAADDETVGTLPATAEPPGSTMEAEWIGSNGTTFRVKTPPISGETPEKQAARHLRAVNALQALTGVQPKVGSLFLFPRATLRAA